MVEVLEQNNISGTAKGIYIYIYIYMKIADCDCIRLKKWTTQYDKSIGKRKYFASMASILSIFN